MNSTIAHKDVCMKVIGSEDNCTLISSFVSGLNLPTFFSYNLVADQSGSDLYTLRKKEMFYKILPEVRRSLFTSYQHFKVLYFQTFNSIIKDSSS